MLNLLPIGIQWISPLVFYITPTGCTTASINCLRQYDLKRLIAYSSISHMNSCISFLFTLNVWGLMSCIVMAVAHLLSSSALFLIAGYIYSRTHSRNLFFSQALIHCYPGFSRFMFTLFLAKISFPGTFNFLGELLGIIALASIDWSLLTLVQLNVLLTTCYSLILYELLSLSIINERIYKLCKLLNNPLYLNNI